MFFASACIAASSVSTAVAATTPEAADATSQCPASNSAQVRAQRAAARRALPRAVWAELEAGPYFICAASRTANGKLAVVSFRMPVAPVGRRAWTKMLFQTEDRQEAAAFARSVRESPQEFLRAISGGTPRTTRIVGVRLIGAYVVLTMSSIRKT